MPISEVIGPKQIALLIALLCWIASREGMRHPGWLLSLQLLSSFVVEVWAKDLALRYEGNLWLYNAAGPVEFCTQMLYAAFVVNRRSTWCIAALFVASYGSCFTYEIFSYGIGDHLMDRSGILSAFLLTVSFTYLLFTLAMSETVVLLRDPRSWLFLGIVIYYGGMIPLIGLLNILTEQDGPSASRLYAINDVLYGVNLSLVVVSSILFRTRTSPNGRK